MLSVWRIIEFLKRSPCIWYASEAVRQMSETNSLGQFFSHKKVIGGMNENKEQSVFTKNI